MSFPSVPLILNAWYYGASGQWVIVHAVGNHVCFAVLSIFGRVSPVPSLDWLCVAYARRVEAWGSRRLYVRCLLCVLCGVPRSLGVGCYLCAGCKNFVCSRVDLSARSFKCCPFVVCRAISVGAVQRGLALGGV